jgi:crotonobetainyl-CoA:carnitine CoA-transferase CaiB-like acyl-CoA transferase
MTGYEDQPPMTPGGMCDPLAGAHAAFAILVALDHRRRTGRGQHLEIPMIELAANVTAEQVAERSAYGVLLSRQANRGPLAAPQGVYACAGDEQWVALAVSEDDHWKGLVRALGAPGWATMPALATERGRRDHHDLLDEHIAEWCAGRTLDDAVRSLRGEGVPVEPVVASARIDHDDQMVARGFWEPVAHPVVGTHRYPGWPFRFSQDGPDHWYHAHAPLLGEHTEEVLRDELGLGADELASLRARAVIGTVPEGL